jgi:hypothetical protein
MMSPDPVEAVASLFGSTMEELEKMLPESEG